MRTGSTELCALDAESAPLLARWKSDPAVNIYWADRRPTSAAEQAAWLAQMQADRTVETFGIAASGRGLVGYVQLFNIDHVNRRAEFRILIGEPECWGKRHGSEATYLTLLYAFEHLNLNKVSLRVLDFNERALRCYRRIGFHEDGVLREDWYRYGRYVDQILMCITAAEFRAAHRERAVPAALEGGGR